MLVLVQPPHNGLEEHRQRHKIPPLITSNAAFKNETGYNDIDDIFELFIPS
jgi:hypothetical protein